MAPKRVGPEIVEIKTSNTYVELPRASGYLPLIPTSFHNHHPNFVLDQSVCLIIRNCRFSVRFTRSL